MLHSLNRVSWLIMVAFLIVAISLGYWSVFASDSMLGRSDNPRLVEAERALMRGGIYDRSGQPLAQTVQVGISPSGQPVVKREYPFPAAASAVGYYSLVHGVGGVEAAFDEQLRGDDLHDAVQNTVDKLLHRVRVGSDVRLTLDIKLQAAILAALANRQGAVAVIDVPSGAVLALVSAPSFDPNTLDQAYDDLLKDPSSPLFNRVTQGLYQPGSALETVILAAMLTNKASLTDPTANAMVTVQINGLKLNCAAQGVALQLDIAYSLACPSLFADATATNPANVQAMIEAFGLLQAPTLLKQPTVTGPLIPVLSAKDSVERLRAEGAGQGQLTVTPLQMALVAATIANNGNALNAYLVDATRAPGQTAWTALDLPHTQRAAITQDVASGIDAAMRAAVTSGAARAADSPDHTVRGHAGLAFTGPQQQQSGWFIGYIMLPNGHLVATAVVVENADPTTAARIGGITLQQAAQLTR